ncbi:hypothetical protein [Nocardia inohanensis]|uniref:hypothetical protein n=1 Tax=Nocardia inohanensis TaxID=209246 RepID=UPI00082D28C1|nr:hypothetical protein [Nocardia inohanensis]
MANTLKHEFLIHLFRCNPDLAATVLRRYLNVAVPEYAVALAASEDATEVARQPQVCKSDVVIIYLHAQVDRPPVWAVIVEVQRGRDPDKPWVWPLYHARIRHRHRCPTTLLVVCPDDAMARWCRTPINTGQPNCTWLPLVTTPRELAVNYHDAEGIPELLALATLGDIKDHDHSSDETMEALLAALAAMEDQHRAREYADGVLDALTGPAKELWRTKLTTSVYRYQTDFAKGYYAEGEAVGRAEGEAVGETKAIFIILRQRGIAVPDAVRDRIAACTDLELIEGWVARALTVTSAEELFGE